VRDLLARHNVAPWPEVRDQLNRILRGWSNYFGYGTRLMAYRAVDHYVYERVRHSLRHRHRVSSRGTARFSIPVVLGEMGALRCVTSHP
jgi:RNA-directed DNA polymerase